MKASPAGQWMIYKVLEQGGFAWPKVQDGVMRLSRAQFEALFEGLDWRRVMAFAAQSAALEAARFEASVERAARQHEQAVVAEKDAFITELKALIERLEGQVGQYRHTKFGPKSEKLDPAQLELALEVEPSWRHRFEPDGEGKPPPRRDAGADRCRRRKDRGQRFGSPKGRPT